MFSDLNHFYFCITDLGSSARTRDSLAGRANASHPNVNCDEYLVVVLMHDLLLRVLKFDDARSDGAIAGRS